MFVGGEFYYEARWAAQSPVIATERMVFLNGGAACLTVISDYLRDHGIHKVLLPSYLCPSILTAFARSGLTWEFYQIQEDLAVDLEDLAQKASRHQAVYFINYFGFFHSPATASFFRQLQQNGVLLIEDNAQAGFPDRTLGDFVFNSIRKLAPYDGGYLMTQHDVARYLQAYAGLANRRLPLIRAYRAGLARYLQDGAGSHSALEQLFQRATDYYETDRIVLGDACERRQIEALDWHAIHQIRRENFQYLMEWVSSIPEITPIYSGLQAENMPFGLPVYCSGVSRDFLYEELGKARVSLMIHWDDLRSDPRTRQSQPAVGMVSKMLTLPIDQRIRRKQMDYLAMQLIRAIAAAKLAQRA